MSAMRVLKYLLGYTVPVSALLSMHLQGYFVLLTPVYAFVIIPFVELIFAPDKRNFSALEEEVVKDDKVYDWILYGHVPLQYFVLYFFLMHVQQPGLHGWEIAGMIADMGICCGVIGINVAHELGHRVRRTEQNMAKLLLLSSLYMHFFIEHNKGHHKRVSTPDDPSTARYNEPVYLFYFRTIIFTIVSAWHIQRAELKAAQASFFSLKNTLGLFFLTELALIATIGLVFGATAMFCFIAAATVGFLLLESVQYIEHYGLQRNLKESGNYERVMPWHSWNSDHILGRVVLYELTRHSDHHYLASRKYQILRHRDEAPQLPAGYPAMILLSLVPPLFFKIMNPRVQAIRAAHAQP